MAPKRKAAKKRHEDEEDEEDDVVVVDEEDDDDDFDEEDEEEEEKPKKRKKPAAASKKKSPAKPRKKAAEKVDIADLVEAEGGIPAPSPAKKPKAAKVTEPTELEDGFTAHPPSLLYKAFGEPSTSSKVAAFDFDGTLVQTKSGLQYPTSGHDWLLYNDQVIPKLQQYHTDGYRIVIFSNQGGIKSALAGAASGNFRQRVSAFLKEAGVPAVVLAATQRDELRKPDRGMWDFYVERFLDGQAPDLTESFFVGDSIDGGDEGFAGNVGITFRSETSEFGEKADRKTAGGGGASAGPRGPVEVTGTGVGPNAELINMFQTLMELAREAGGEKAHFKVAALKKVADILQQYPHKITEAKLKEVGNLKGVGKASIDKIKEWLATGTMRALTEGEDGGGASQGAKAPAGKEGKAMEGKGRAEALQFM